MSTGPALPFSKFRKAQGLVYLSGEMPFDEQGNVPDGIAAQTALTLRRISATLEQAGLTLADVVNVTVHLTHPEDFAEFNAVYREFFSEPYPTRTTVAAALMVLAGRVEITVIAADRASA